MPCGRAPTSTVNPKQCVCSRRIWAALTWCLFERTKASWLLRAFVACDTPFEGLSIREEDWEMTVEDGGEARRLHLDRSWDAEIIPLLLHRALLLEVGRRTDRWTLDSPRKWYESQAFAEANGVVA